MNSTPYVDRITYLNGLTVKIVNQQIKDLMPKRLDIPFLILKAGLNI